MNKTEYWFLDAAIELKVPLYWLSASNVDEMLNRPHHNLSAQALLEVLEQMFDRGELFLEYTNRYKQSYRTQAPSRRAIESALFMTTDEWMGRPEQVMYGVTGRGGATWETLSQPQWDRFYVEGYGINPYEGEITASERGLVEQLLRRAPYDSMVKAIVPESIRWSVLHPWEATYWKQVPIGYQVEFTYLTRSGDEEMPLPPKWVRRWYQLRHRWYTHYLETGSEV